ncbi:cytochrome P450 [Paraburkholderia humisilvae]|uniref:Vitamin D(3) 25-hydroxylase n=1 Tax=Paraburkholderia humisilvae TaxID=627669 RepID=A0A6J5D7T5_9BURK|nr:cytochrome P450 [Paraburkholderia humisilvae]CAB3749414.1 Vitamin D(3) 25-hydroxylase [Paraburkholderia humisilvae]
MNAPVFQSPAFFNDPYPYYEALREQGPVVALTADGRRFATARYSSVTAVLDDRRMGRHYLSNVARRYGEARAAQPVFQALGRMFIMMDPPEHTPLRALLMQAFNARQVEKLHDVTRATAARLINALPRDTPFDIVSGYALPLPVQVIAGMLDLPFDEAATIGAAMEHFARAFEAIAMDEPTLAAANHATLELEQYFQRVLEARRTRPGNDLVSMLLAVEADGRRLTDAEIVSNVLLLFFAGHETTSNMIGNALVSLVRHPQQLDHLRQQPELLQKAIVECMRYESSVQIAQRTVLEDGVEIEGIALPRGAIVTLMLGGANRDPAQFHEPNQLIIDRTENVRRMLSFGGGLHYCLGARLAMLELHIALDILFMCLPHLRVVNLHDLHWRQHNTLRGVDALWCEHPIAERAVAVA